MKKYHLIRFRSIRKNLYIVCDYESDHSYYVEKVLLQHPHVFINNDSMLSKNFYNHEKIFSDDSLEKVLEQGMLEVL